MLDDVFDFLLDFFLELSFWEVINDWLKKNIGNRFLRWTICCVIYGSIIALLAVIFYGIVYLIKH